MSHDRIKPQNSGHAARLRLYYCHVCDKWTYATRAVAKRVAKAAHPSDGHMDPYPCPQRPEHWHYGHDHVRLHRAGQS